MARVVRGPVLRTGNVITGPKKVEGGKAKWKPPVPTARQLASTHVECNYLIDGVDNFGRKVFQHVARQNDWVFTRIHRGLIKKWDNDKDDYIDLFIVFDRTVRIIKD